MNPQVIRGVLALATVLLCVGGALAPFNWPIDVGPVLFIGACFPALLLLAERLLGGWLERHRGDSVTPADFLRERWSLLAIRAGGLLAVAGSAGALKTQVLMEPRAWPVFVALIGVLIVATGFFVSLSTRKSRRADPLADLFELTTKRTLDDEIEQAIGFNRAVAPRLLLDFAGLALIGIVMGGLSLAIGYGIFYLGLKIDSIEQIGFSTELNLISQAGIVVAFAGLGISYAAVSLTLFRLVGIARRTGRRPGAGTLRQFGHALETIGIVSTTPWALVMAATMTLLAFSSWVVASSFLPEGNVLLGVVIAGTIVTTWAILFLPQMHIFTLFCHRDCGWINSIEASTVLVGLEGPASLKRALVVTMWSLSLVRIPGAIHLLLGMMDDRAQLLAVLLREKGVSESMGQVLDSMSNQPEALRRPYEALEAGRFLEALNQFQIYLHRNRGDVSATRGECLAMLYLGNFRGARDKLEYWKNLDPSAQEPDEHLTEIRDGRWGEDGDLLKAARGRSAEAPLPTVRPMSDFAPP